MEGEGERGRDDLAACEGERRSRARPFGGGIVCVSVKDRERVYIRAQAMGRDDAFRGVYCTASFGAYGLRTLMLQYA